MPITVEDIETGALVVLESLDQTCLACPSQWDARTDLGERVYVRYRWGVLSVDLTRPHALKPNRGLDETLGDPFDGVVDFVDIEHLVARGIDIARRRWASRGLGA